MPTDFTGHTDEELAADGRAWFEEVERRIPLSSHPDKDRLGKRFGFAHLLAGDVGKSFADAGTITPNSIGDK